MRSKFIFGDSVNTIMSGLQFFGNTAEESINKIFLPLKKKLLVAGSYAVTVEKLATAYVFSN